VLDRISDGEWRCRQCGRLVVTGRRADGKVFEPRPDDLPPCGWRGLDIELGGHYWTELYIPNGRLWTCGRCQRRVSLPADTTDDRARDVLATQTECPATSRTSPKQQPHASPPGLAQRVWSYAQAVARWMAAGRPTRSAEEIARLLAICRACPHYDPKAQICRVCGCRTTDAASAWRNKLAMATEECPMGKWGVKLSPEELKTFVDRVYVINLKSRPDRLKTFFLNAWNGLVGPFPIPLYTRLSTATWSGCHQNSPKGVEHTDAE